MGSTSSLNYWPGSTPDQPACSLRPSTLWPTPVIRVCSPWESASPSATQTLVTRKNHIFTLRLFFYIQVLRFSTGQTMYLYRLNEDNLLVLFCCFSDTDSQICATLLRLSVVWVFLWWELASHGTMASWDCCTLNPWSHCYGWATIEKASRWCI